MALRRGRRTCCRHGQRMAVGQHLRAAAMFGPTNGDMPQIGNAEQYNFGRHPRSGGGSSFHSPRWSRRSIKELKRPCGESARSPGPPARNSTT